MILIFGAQYIRAIIPCLGSLCENSAPVAKSQNQISNVPEMNRTSYYTIITHRLSRMSILVISLGRLFNELRRFSISLFFHVTSHTLQPKTIAFRLYYRILSFRLKLWHLTLQFCAYISQLIDVFREIVVFWNLITHRLGRNLSCWRPITCTPIISTRYYCKSTVLKKLSSCLRPIH